MKLWLVDRSPPIGWDEWDAFVIRAETSEQAVKIARKEGGRSWRPKNHRATEIQMDGEPEVILGSFNAG